MKLIYTDFYQNLTPILVQEAKLNLEQGKRVFYIAPNSLSFEKEKKVLEELGNGAETASFQLMVTRFSQLSRYFLLNHEEKHKQISDTGYAMILYKVLQRFTEDDLRVYNRFTKDHQFIQQLLSLYKELKESNISIIDLYEAEHTPKYQDLVKIFTVFQEELDKEDYISESNIQEFTRNIWSGEFTEDLQNIVIVVDGFSRFSGEEESLLEALEGQVSEIIVGTYCSEKAYRTSYPYGNIYQASLEFIERLKKNFVVESVYKPVKKKKDTFTKLTTLLESISDFTADKEDKIGLQKDIEIWNVVNQKEEIEHVAKSIRQLLYHHKELHYRDILVLLGDDESYSLQIGQIFSRYHIPYYIGKEEKMQDHPLLHFLDSLLKIKKYHYQTEDIVNLIKTGLYGRVNQSQIDQLDQYLKYSLVKGRAGFTREFKLNVREKYSLSELNDLREELLGENSPLQIFLQKRVQKGKSLVNHFLTFLKTGQVLENLTEQSEDLSEMELENNEEVWKNFTDILTEFTDVFQDEKMTVEEFLELLSAAIFSLEYRTVPATVDVVNVKSYDLVQPHSSRFVYAIGLSREHFPRRKKGISIVTEQERLNLNQYLEKEDKTEQLSVASLEADQQALYTALSLYNSASEKLVLSTPDIYGESQSEMSDYLIALASLGVPVYKKSSAHYQEDLEHIGSYEGLLSNLVRVNRELNQSEMIEKNTFWAILSNHLQNYLRDKKYFNIATTAHDMETSRLSPEVIEILYPSAKEIKVSTSSIENFYACQYKYYLQHQLRLQELDSAKPDSRIHGMFLHRVFERLMNNISSQPFDEKLEAAIKETRWEYKEHYHQSKEQMFLEQTLLDIVRESASVIQSAPNIRTLELERYFSEGIPLASQGRQLQINGQIDRIDSMEGYLGVVDYKSSEKKFNLLDFYYHQSLQLVTYLYALTKSDSSEVTNPLFGAMYFHLQNPNVSLADGNPLESLTSSLRYQGLFNEEVKEHLQGVYHTSSLYSTDEMRIMMDYAEKTYMKAANQLVTGNVKINPYAEKSNTAKACTFCKFKSVCRFEANLYMNQANIVTKPRMTKELRNQIMEKMSKEE